VAKLIEFDETGAGGIIISPDRIASRGRDPVLSIDTKWMRLSARADDSAQGVAESHVKEADIA
jgi:hypothetical protein